MILKRRRTQEAWFKLVEDFDHQEMTIDDYCLVHQVSKASYYKYKKKLKQVSPSFLPIVFKEPTPTALVFESHGFKLKVDENISVKQLHKLLKATAHDL